MAMELKGLDVSKERYSQQLFFFCFEVTVMICCDTEAIAAFKFPVLASEWASLRKGSRRRKAVRGRVNKFLVFW